MLRGESNITVMLAILSALILFFIVPNDKTAQIIVGSLAFTIVLTTFSYPQQEKSSAGQLFKQSLVVIIFNLLIAVPVVAATVWAAHYLASKA
ncbi:hypothetical protein [Rheinheimera sp.]|jgi:Trk-type K+ transport system membrane component|uniref:hypothetical protein n=1 Tax=Rheinheimera sp. TaxID=1869214 RepID=UPI002352F1B4|nr:hypothetical protein [Rheinheimera sp.]